MINSTNRRYNEYINTLNKPVGVNPRHTNVRANINNHLGGVTFKELTGIESISSYIKYDANKNLTNNIHFLFLDS